LYSHPTNRFVAGFIGSPAMNLVELDSGAGPLRLGTLDLTPGSAASSAGAAVDGPVTVGVRPEHLRLDTTGVPGGVIVVEELGSQSFIHVTINHQGGDVVLVVRDAGETQTKRGDNVHLNIAGPVHLFDASGERIDP
jgi:multiple sugar transport system ATP-binding protein